MPNIDSNSHVPIYVQLYRYIKQEIISGHIEPETKLPSIRKLSSFLKISRTTVEATYHQLSVEGYITSKPNVGYFVSKIDNDMLDYDKRNTISKIITDEDELDSHIRYDFVDEHVDSSSFDFKLWKRYINRALSFYDKRLLTYGSYQGEYELRKQINKYVLQFRGAVCFPEQIVIGAGVQSLLNMLCGLVKPFYSKVAFEDPSFNKARYIFKDGGFDIIPIPLENDGIETKVLSELDADLIYVSPAHQFPTGSIMPVNKRVQLLKWAYDREALIIEDDYDSELMYYGRPIPSLQGMNKGKDVIYMGSFSKIMLPSIRISYMILPEDMLEIYMRSKEKYNQSSSKLEQLALALFMEDGMLEKHIRRLRKIYAKKNQILIQAIKTIMGDNVNIIGERTGLHLLLEVKSSKNSDQLAAQAEKRGVKVTPISNYMIKPQQTGKPLILLAYGGIPIEDISDAIETLSDAWEL